MDKLNIIIVEDDYKTRENFKNLTYDSEDFNIISILDNSDDAIRDIAEFRPDAIILDLELHNGGGTGIDVMLGIKSLEYKPFILITTNNSSSVIHKQVRDLGADFILTKYQHNYSEKSALDFLLSVKSLLPDTASDNISLHEYSAEEKEKRIKIKIAREFDYVGINPKRIGYQYLTDAILLWIGNSRTSIIPAIAQKYNSTVSKVERAMRTVIENAWTKSSTEVLEKHYTAIITSPKGAPTVLQFIAYYAEKVTIN